MSKPKAAVILAMCLLGIAVLGVMTWQELNDRREGVSYYTELSGSMEQLLRPVEVDTATASAPVESTVNVLNAPAVGSALDFDLLRETCPDAVGWIAIPGTCVNYPVVRGEDNDFYLSHLPNRQPNKAGSIMMDTANAPDFTDDVTILHGHHMRNGEMFGDLAAYKDPAYWQEHPEMMLYTPRGDHRVEIVAACTVDGRTFGYDATFASDELYAAFVRRLRQESYFYAQVSVEPGDRLILLSTCAYQFQNARFIVLGKIVENVPAE